MRLTRFLLVRAHAQLDPYSDVSYRSLQYSAGLQF